MKNRLSLLASFISMIKYIRQNKPTFLIVLFLYSVITIFMTFPLIFNITTHVPGWVDVWQNLWLLWHTKLALTDPTESLFYTNYLFYPTGTPLIPMSLYNQLLSVPLQYLFSLHITYNLLFLSSFVLAGTTTFYLIKYFTENSYAAFIGGLIYAFAPNTLAHGLGHLEAITTGWIPLYILLLFKLSEKKYSFKDEVKSAFLAAIGLIMVAASDLLYMMFLIIFTGLFVIYWIVIERSITFLTSRKFIIFCGIFLIGALPFTYPLMQYTFSDQNFLKPQFGDLIKHSADLVGFFIPSKLHSLFGSYTAPIFSKFTGGYSENVTFLGYTIIILISYVFIKGKGQMVTFWKTSFLFTFLLSLGPILHIMGKTIFNGKPVFLPYFVLYYTVPFLQNARTIGRMDVLVMLSAAVLFAYGISQLFKKMNDHKKLIATAVLSLIILFEFIMIPFPLSEVDKPDFYKNLSKDQRKNIILVEVPMNYTYGVKSMYYQTIHGKKIISGTLAREPSYVHQFTIETPGLYELHELTYYEMGLIDDIISRNRSEKAQASQAILNYYNITYIIIGEDYLTNQQLANVTLVLNEVGARKIIQSGRQIVYEIPVFQPTLYMNLGTGWYQLERWNIIPARWMENNATLRVYSNENRTATLSMQILSFYNSKNLEIYVSDIPVVQMHAIPTNFSWNKAQIDLKKGVNIIKLHVLEGCEKPIDILGLKNEDNRCLSVAFQNITIVLNT